MVNARAEPGELVFEINSEIDQDLLTWFDDPLLSLGEQHIQGYLSGFGGWGKVHEKPIVARLMRDIIAQNV